jgi:glycosyltransferase involved in cell wall biosynthesis
LVDSSAPLTVAIPTCNGAALLAETLRSILIQSCGRFELLVCDDASDDDTLDLVRNLAADRARIVVNEHRLGLAGNWNRCVAECRTPLIAIVHQDDVLGPGHLEAHIAAFDGDPRIGLVASASTVIDEHGGEIPGRVVERGGLGPADRVFLPEGVVPLLAVGNPLRCSAVSIRVAAYQDVGGFDPAYRYVLDWDFWLRVARRWRLAWLAQPTVKVRWHRDSETHRFKVGSDDLDESRRLLERLFGQASLSPALVASLRGKSERRLARAFLNRAHDALRAGRIELARRCLRDAVRLCPWVIGSILGDPRLAVQMAAVAAAPKLAQRWFSSPT